MELVNGGDLLEFIHKRGQLGTEPPDPSSTPIEARRLDEATAQNMTRQLCGALEVRWARKGGRCMVLNFLALQYSHSMGITHRDLKPEVRSFFLV
jgi:serine/threonine protein kinase